MAFNIKVSVVLLVMLVVATSADARADLSEVFVTPESAGKQPKFCTYCECDEYDDEFDTTECYRYEVKGGGVPLACDLADIPTLCAHTYPPQFCVCKYKVETCTPEQCPQNTAPELEDLLSLNRNY